jgi:hypothetical protein
MNKQTEASFATASWEEKTWDGQLASDVKGAKQTHVVAAATYTGALAGTSTLQLVMTYVADGTYGEYVGVEHFTGTLDGKAGSFDMVALGTFDLVKVVANVTVVKDSGTGDLAGLQGTMRLHMEGHGPYPFKFDYSL